MTKTTTARNAVADIKDNATIAVNSSSGLCCPDAVLRALGERFDQEGAPRGLTAVHPIAAGDLFGTPGVDHIAKPGLLAGIVGGSYPSGPSSAEQPLIWGMVSRNELAAYNVPSGIIFDMLREGAAKRPGVLTEVGMGTFADPDLEGCAMNAAARERPIVRRETFDGKEWLYFKAIRPDVAIIRASLADERGNLCFDREGAYLGALEMALTARNTGGKVIAQVRHVAKNGTIKPHDVHVPGVLVDAVVEAPDMLQTTATAYDPAISGELSRPLDSFEVPEFGIGKVIARRVACELRSGWSVNIGFGVSANVPRILLEEGLHGSVTWVIEQGAVGGLPLLGFKFGCSANAEAFVPAPQQFCYFQAGGFDAALLSFLEIGSDGSVNVSRLPSKPHRTAGAGGIIDITARAKKLVFSGNFDVGSEPRIENGSLRIAKEGKLPKFVDRVNQVSFSGPRALAQGQDVTYVTERCVMKLVDRGLVVTEIAPGLDLQRDVIDRCESAVFADDPPTLMDPALFQPETMGLTLGGTV